MAVICKSQRWLSGAACLVAALAFGGALGAAEERPPVGPQVPPPAFSPAAGRLDPTADPPQGEPVAVEREYDRFQDKTTIKVEGVRPTVTKGESRIFINATSSCDGPEVVAKPDKIALNLLAVSDEFQYADLRDGLQFILLIDNKRVRVPAKFVKAGMTRDRTPRSLESFVAIVDASVLVGMATAQSVECQLGTTEFKLGAMEQLSLRRFAETVNLVAPLPKPAAEALDGALSAGPVRADAVAMHIAQAKVDEAQEKVDRLTVACIQRLEQVEAYQAAVKATQELEAKKDRAPAGPQRADISQQWLEAKAKVGLLRSSAMLEDAELAAARRELVEAQSAVKGMQRSLDRAHVPAASR
jgi:hypothetical protein